MPINKFQDNIQIINLKSQQFQNFLNQVKPRHSLSQNRTNDLQQNIQNTPSSQIITDNRKSYEPSFRHEDLYENKSQFKNRCSPIQNFQQTHQSYSQFEIQKSQKLNPNPHKFSQQDNIKNQHPGHLIVLKSANQLPPWLFDHIRKKNAKRLKNICLKEDKQQYNQIFRSDEQQIEEKNSLGKTKSKLTQRYLNQSYSARNQKSELNPQAFRQRSSKNNHNHFYQKREDYRNFSSSFEIPYFQKFNHVQKMKKTQKSKQICINDYEYSYCPDLQIQNQKGRSFKSANHNSSYIEQANSRRMRSGQKQKSNQYRIRQQEKMNKVHAAPKTPEKRLPTVSEQQPLSEPKKFMLS